MPHFLKIVMGFRRKFSSCDEDFIACYSQISYMGTRQEFRHEGDVREAECDTVGDFLASLASGKSG